MGTVRLTAQLDSEMIAALDEIAAHLGRDRSHVLNEAMDVYIEMHRWQIRHVKEGLRQADAGEFASDEEVAAVFVQRPKSNQRK